MNSRSSFTLIELLVVIAILAILSVAVVLVINPADIIKQSRDSQRLTDLNNLNKALAVFDVTNPDDFTGTSTVVYTSLPDSTTTCANLSLPALPAGYTYQCVTSSTLAKADGTGWIPVNFTNVSYGSPLTKIPVDPINSSTTGQYYTYIMGGSWELNAVVESNKYRNDESISKPNLRGVMSVGSNKTLSPIYNVGGLTAYYPLSSDKTEYNGTDLLAGWDFSNWGNENSTDTSNTFSSTAGNGGMYKSILTQNNTYRIIVQGTQTGSDFYLSNTPSIARLVSTSDTNIDIDYVFKATIGPWLGLRLGASGQTATITKFEIYQEQAQDVSTNAYDGTITAGASAGFVADQRGVGGRAYDFDGANTKIDTGSDFIGTSAVTISAWVYLDNYGESGKGMIFDNGKSALDIEADRIVYYSNGTADLAADAYQTLYISTGVWHHIAVSKPTSAQSVIFYVDGMAYNPVGAFDETGVTQAGTNNVIIGNNNAASRTFDGGISDVRIYNRALSAAEIRAIYNSTR